MKKEDIFFEDSDSPVNFPPIRNEGMWDVLDFNFEELIQDQAEVEVGPEIPEEPQEEEEEPQEEEPRMPEPRSRPRPRYAEFFDPAPPPQHKKVRAAYPKDPEGPSNIHMVARTRQFVKRVYQDPTVLENVRPFAESLNWMTAGKGGIRVPDTRRAYDILNVLEGADILLKRGRKYIPLCDMEALWKKSRKVAPKRKVRGIMPESELSELSEPELSEPELSEPELSEPELPEPDLPALRVPRLSEFPGFIPFQSPEPYLADPLSMIMEEEDEESREPRRRRRMIRARK